MTRPRVILGPSGAYLVRAETKGGRPILASPSAAELLVTTLAYFRQALSFRLYAYAVLPDALEAVIQPEAPSPAWGDFSPPGGDRKVANISKIMMDVKGSFAYWYNRRAGRRGSVWEKRFKDVILLSTEEIRAGVLKVHSRPVVLRLSERPEDFPYSGLTAGRNPVKLLDALPVKLGNMPVPVKLRRTG
jgi:hypothetical protein